MASANPFPRACLGQEPDPEQMAGAGPEPDPESTMAPEPPQSRGTLLVLNKVNTLTGDELGWPVGWALLQRYGPRSRWERITY